MPVSRKTAEAAAVSRDPSLPYWRSECGRATVYVGDCREVLAALEAEQFHAVVTDPPFSERTHRGHDSSANGHIGEGNDGANRKILGYTSWNKEIIESFISKIHPLCGGWIVCFTDHTLIPHWCNAMSGVGRYVFAPLPWYVSGSTCRLSGDGPSSWTRWIVVSRTVKQSKWGTLPGGYTQRGKQEKMGGKPVELMEAIVKDYSREGDTVLDPCMGRGSTGIACIRTNRRFIGIEIDQQCCDHAIGRLRLSLEATGARETLPPAKKMRG